VNPIPHTLGALPCIDFVNSRFTDHLGGGAVIDRLDAPVWRTWFLERWKLSAIRSQPDLRVLKEARETLRRVLEAWAAGRSRSAADLKRLDAWLAAAPMRRRFGGGMLPVTRDWAWALAEIVASAEQLLATSDPRRLKSCANPGCTWMFLDESRNQSRRWCDPATCGNLITVREFRRRQLAASASA
jgi:predicted RNA-binding Zn ribbon-like protein